MRFFPRNSTVTAAIYRLPTSGDRKYPTSATSTVEGAFKQLYRRAHDVEGGMFVIDFEMYVDATADVQRGDKIVVTGNTAATATFSGTYFVRKTTPQTVGVFPFILVYLSTEA